MSSFALDLKRLEKAVETSKNECSSLQDKIRQYEDCEQTWEDRNMKMEGEAAVSEFVGLILFGL